MRSRCTLAVREEAIVPANLRCPFQPECMSEVLSTCRLAPALSSPTQRLASWETPKPCHQEILALALVARCHKNLGRLSRSCRSRIGPSVVSVLPVFDWLLRKLRNRFLVVSQQVGNA